MRKCHTQMWSILRHLCNCPVILYDTIKKNLKNETVRMLTVRFIPFLEFVRNLMFWMEHFMKIKFCDVALRFWLNSSWCFEGSYFLQNIKNYSPSNTALHPSKIEYSTAVLCKPQIWHRTHYLRDFYILRQKGGEWPTGLGPAERVVLNYWSYVQLLNTITVRQKMWAAYHHSINFFVINGHVWL